MGFNPLSSYHFVVNWPCCQSLVTVTDCSATNTAVRDLTLVAICTRFKHQGWQHQISPCNSDCEAASLGGCHDARVRSHNVMPRDAIMMSVMMHAPTRDHVAIWYSMRGLGVGSGVVVTNTVQHFFCNTLLLNMPNGQQRV